MTLCTLGYIFIHFKSKRKREKALQSRPIFSNPPPHKLHLEPGQYTVNTHHPHNEEKTCKWQISEALKGRKLSEGPLVNLQHRPQHFDMTKCYTWKNAMWSTAHLQSDTWDYQILPKTLAPVMSKNAFQLTTAFVREIVRKQTHVFILRDLCVTGYICIICQLSNSWRNNRKHVITIATHSQLSELIYY